MTRRHTPSYLYVCRCDALLDPTDDTETGVRCRCLASVSRRRGHCANCKAGAHLDTQGKRLAVPA